MPLQYAETTLIAHTRLFFQDADETTEFFLERRRKPLKFKQDRNFPAHKKARSYRRQKELH
ncbi:MAG: hypothetical protein ACO1RX_05405 [Candidatus Sericytochromatia bacterium]